MFSFKETYELRAEGLKKIDGKKTGRDSEKMRERTVVKYFFFPT